MLDTPIYSLGGQIVFAKLEGKRLSQEVENDFCIAKEMLEESFREVKSLAMREDPERCKVLQTRFEYILEQFSTKVEEMREITDKIVKLQTVT